MQEPHGGNGQTSGISALARVYWMLVGNVALIFSLVTMGERKSVVLPSTIYWSVVLSIIAVRYIDIRFLNGRTADGSRPATMKHLGIHALILVAAASCAWAFALFAGRNAG